MLAALSQKHIIRSSWFSWINEKKRPKITQVKSLKYYFCTVRSFPRAINQKPNISQKQDLKDASPPTVDQFKHQKWSQWKGNREKSKRYAKLHKKWTENHWPQVSWSDKYKCKIYGSDQHRHVQKYQEKGTTVSVWNRLQNTVTALSWFWAAFQPVVWRSCQNWRKYECRKSTMQYHLECVWQASFFSMTVILDTLSIQWTHTWIEKHTIEQYQSWIGHSTAWPTL